MTDFFVAWLNEIAAGARAASAAELIAVVLGLGYIVLAIRGRRAAWIAGGASTAIYAAIFFRAGLPLQSALQLVYVALSVYGWRAWGVADARAAAPRSWPWSRHVVAVAIVGLATAASVPLLAHYLEARAPLADSLGTWASVVATWLLARRIIGTWPWWIVVDGGLAGFFASQGLAFTAALYLVYAALAVAGWRAWLRAGVLHS